MSKAEAELEQTLMYNENNAKLGFVKIPVVHASWREQAEKLAEALKFYASTRRDTSFEGWEKEWRYIEAKHDSDYEYYPNHDVATEALAEFEKWKGEK